MYYLKAESDYRSQLLAKVMATIEVKDKHTVVVTAVSECPSCMVRVYSVSGGIAYRVDTVFFVGDNVHWSRDAEDCTAEEAMRLVAMRLGEIV